MKRKRTIIPGASYFVTVKTNGGVKYLASPLAKTMFVETLERLKVKHDCCIGNFVVLDDEIQLIIKPAGDTSLAETMKWLLGVYTQNHNRVFDGSGHIFGNRYDSRPIRDLYHGLGVVRPPPAPFRVPRRRRRHGSMVDP